MKKTAVITATAIVLSAVSPICASAMTDDEAYAYQPSAYFRLENNSFEVLKSGNIYITKDKLSADNTLKLSSFYKDDSLFSKIVMLRVASSDTENIKLTNVVNPADAGETQAYNQSKELYNFVFDTVQNDIVI